MVLVPPPGISNDRAKPGFAPFLLVKFGLAVRFLDASGSARGGESAAPTVVAKGRPLGHSRARSFPQDMIGVVQAAAQRRAA
jgi:hypothetical protein